MSKPDMVFEGAGELEQCITILTQIPEEARKRVLLSLCVFFEVQQ